MPMAKTVGYHRFVVVGGLAVLGSRPAEHLPSRIGKNIGKLRQTDNEGEVPNNEALTLEEARDKDEIYLLSRRRKKKKNFLKPQYATR